LSGELRPAQAHDASPSDSDAELPRIVPSGSGFVIVWIAHRPDPAAVDASAAFEATSEGRSFGWLEMVTVDEHGIPSAAVRHLTPTTGHVSAYDVRVVGEGPSSVMWMVARDDGEAVDGSGGSLIRIRVTGEAVDPPVDLPTDGLGRGAPAFVEASPPESTAWVTWVGHNEQLRLLALDSSGAPSGLTSREDAIESARPLLFLSRGERLVVAATPEAAPPPERELQDSSGGGGGEADIGGRLGQQAGNLEVLSCLR
jgi:hypothetical protein